MLQVVFVLLLSTLECQVI